MHYFMCKCILLEYPPREVDTKVTKKGESGGEEEEGKHNPQSTDIYLYGFIIPFGSYCFLIFFMKSISGWVLLYEM